jgi:branched-chain amino acid transport system ATP-binding protein
MVAKLGISRTFQNIRLFNNLTVLENVLVGSFLPVQSVNSMAFALRTDKARKIMGERTRVAQEVLQFVGIEHLSWTRASALSYGDQRRLEIARALATEPRLLLLDEPTAGMNPQEREAALLLFQKIRSVGITLFVVEHHMRVIMEICDRVIVLDQGRKISEGSPQEVQNDPRVVQAYLGEEVV